MSMLNFFVLQVRLAYGIHDMGSRVVKEGGGVWVDETAEWCMGHDYTDVGVMGLCKEEFHC